MWGRSVCAALLVCSLAACGDDEGNGANGDGNGGGNGNGQGGVSVTCNDDFDMNDACGGDPTGTWTLGEVCGTDIPSEAAGLAEQCPTASISNLAYDVSGTLTIDDSTFTEALAGTVSADVNVPSECLTIEGMPINCDALQALVSLEEGLSAVCEAGDNDSCDCGITADLAFSSAGSYTTASGVATVSTSDGAVEYYYCVENGQLTLRETTTSNPAGRPVFAYGQ